MIRALLADDQALVRAGFRMLLDTEDGFEVVGEAADGADAVALARSTRPDVVVMDVRMPGVDGLAATKQITEDPDLADVRVLVLTTFDVDEYVFEALRGGASGFLLKDTEPVDLLRALRVVARGEALLAPTITRRLIAEFVARPARHQAGPGLARASSPGGNGKSRAGRGAGCPTTRSPPSWSSARPPRALTSAGRW